MTFLRLSSFWLPSMNLDNGRRESEEPGPDRLGSSSRAGSGFVDDYTDLGGDRRVGKFSFCIYFGEYEVDVDVLFPS
jgi:hypothetical protein